MLKKAIAVLLVGVLGLAAVGCSSGNSSSKSDSTSSTNSSSAASGAVDGYTVPHGQVLDIKKTDLNGKSILVVKAKIKTDYGAILNVNQNYLNVADIIKDQGGTEFDEIQYWAVADTKGGDEVKVISFTVPKSTIQGVADDKIADNQIGQYCEDLYINKALQS